MARFALGSCLCVLAACGGTGSTRDEANGFGAAAWAPADSACFASLHAPARQLRDLARSQAFAALSQLPFVREALAEIEGSMAMLQAARRKQPLLDDWLAVLADAGEREVFVAAGPELAPFSEAVLAIVRESMFVGMAAGMSGRRPTRQQDAELLTAVLSTVLQNAEALHLPPVTVGLRLADRVRGKSLIDRLAAAAKQLPGRVASLREADTDYQVWELTADAFPNWRMHFERALAMGGLPAAQVKGLVAFVAGLKLSVAGGLRGDTLLLSVGHGTDHLARFGRATPLVETQEFANLRKRGQRGLLSLAWVSGAMRNLGRLPVPSILALVDRALPAAPGGETRAGTKQRFLDDLRRFLVESDERIGSASPLLSATFQNRGLEALRVGSSRGVGDSGSPLSLLRRAGSSPLFAWASRSAPVTADYEWVSQWARVFFQHFTVLAVPRMSARDRAEFATFGATFGPAFLEFDAMTREHLLPAVDGTEGLLLADGWIEVDRWPGAAGPLPQPFRLPRAALVWQLNDSEEWLQACRGYGAMIEGLLERLAASREIGAMPAWEAPEAQQVDGGTLWSWPVTGFGAELEPCMLVAGNTVVFALTPAHAEELRTRNASPAKGLVDLHGPSASVGTMDVASFFGWLQRDVPLVLGAAGVERGVLTQVEAVLRALGAVRQLQCRSYRQDGLDVAHSWLEVEDRR